MIQGKLPSFPLTFALWGGREGAFHRGRMTLPRLKGGFYDGGLPNRASQPQIHRAFLLLHEGPNARIIALEGVSNLIDSCISRVANLLHRILQLVSSEKNRASSPRESVGGGSQLVCKTRNVERGEAFSPVLRRGKGSFSDVPVGSPSLTTAQNSRLQQECEECTVRSFSHPNEANYIESRLYQWPFFSSLLWPLRRRRGRRNVCGNQSQTDVSILQGGGGYERQGCQKRQRERG